MRHLGNEVVLDTVKVDGEVVTGGRAQFSSASIAMKPVFLAIAVAAAVYVSAQEAMPLAGARVVVADQFWDTTDGEKRAQGTDENWGLTAAQDLTNALCKVLGGKVPLFRESEAPEGGDATVYLGPTKAAATAGLDAKSMMAGEWRIKCDGRTAFILSRTDMGAANGVTDFLDKFANYRFMTLDGDDPFTVNPGVSVPVCDFTSKHSFYVRHFATWDRFFIDTCHTWMGRYMRRQGLCLSHEAEGRVRQSMRMRGVCHTYPELCPPKKYFTEHPEYFSMDPKGKRVNGPLTMLCLSNPDVRKIVTDRFLEMIEQDRAQNPADPPAIYNFTQTDGIYYICKCPECSKIAARYGGDTGLQMDFVNELAHKIGAKYPDVRIRTFAYVNTIEPPKEIVPEPNVIIWFCDWYMKSDHQLPLEHPVNAYCRNLLEKWCAITPQIELWDYMLYQDAFPELAVDAIAADARYFRKLGLSRFFIECEHHGQPFWQLNTYVYSKFFRDPDTDLEKAIDEYCAVYGAGAAKMREAIDFLRKIIAENPPKSADLWHQRVLPWRTIKNMERLRKVVREAMAAETRVKPRARMALVLESVDRELAKCYKSVQGCGAMRKEVMDEWKDCARTVFDGGLFAGKDNERRFKRSEETLAYVDFRFKHLPEELKEVPEEELIALDLHSSPFIGQANKRVADTDSECKFVARLVPSDPAHPLDWAVVRDLETGQRDTFDINLVKDNGYRWYRLGVSRVGRAGACVLQSGMQFFVGDLYIECDGMAEDPNWYEFWLAIKYNGNPYSKKDGEGLFVDRLLLRHAKKP